MFPLDGNVLIDTSTYPNSVPNWTPFAFLLFATVALFIALVPISEFMIANTVQGGPAIVIVASVIISELPSH